ncbi:MAG TPA: GDP-mannose 4,6-dehydratase, partial [candidate division Zixibacteria bacterium]|nr:GDP-mannose 4,6-dehydratase [candidate division Zixibacteria bacterium]
VIRTRSFNHAGPRQALGFVIPDFASQVAKIDLNLQEPILKVGDLRAKRDISDVRDIVSGYYLLMKKGKPGEVYNIGSGKIYSLKKVLQHLVSLSSRKIKVEIDKTRLRKIDIPVLQADISKIKKDTGWKAKTPLEKTLQDTYNFWREYWLENQN